MQALLGSLAGCVGMDVVMILGSKMEEIRSLKIVTEGVKRRTPPKEFLSIESVIIFFTFIKKPSRPPQIILGRAARCLIIDRLLVLHFVIFLEALQVLPMISLLFQE